MTIDFDQLCWQDFEQLAVRLVKIVYGRHNIEVMSTSFTADGGRDGEGLLDVAQDEGEEFSLKIRIWVEAKRRKHNVNLEDIGANIVYAANKSVNKIIFITNKKFSKGAKSEVENFCNRSNFSYTFIDGDQLYNLINKYGISSESLGDNQAVEITSYNNYVSDTRTEINISSWISTERNGTVKICEDDVVNLPNIDCPIYYHVDIDTDFHFIPKKIRISLNTHDSDIIINSMNYNHNYIIGPNERVRFSFCLIFEKNKEFNLESISINIDSNIDERYINYDCARNKIKITSDLIPEIRINEQDNFVNDVISITNKWVNENNSRFIVIAGSAGTGKSHIISKIRKNWLRQGIVDLHIDCDKIDTDAKLLLELFVELFPIKTTLFDHTHLDLIENWFNGQGLPAVQAEKIAQQICIQQRINPASYSSEMLSNVVYTALYAIAQRHGKITLVIEDLHKAKPAFIALLRELGTRIKQHLGKPILLICTTRHYTSISQTLHDNWYEEMENLWPKLEGSVITVNHLVEREAVAFLKKIIPTASKDQLSRIIRQVDRTPFGLREACLYLYAENIIERKQDIHTSFHILKPELLSERIDSEKIKSSTELRIKAFYKKIEYDLNLSVRNFLVSAAQIGRIFTVAPLFDIEKIPTGDEFEAILEACIKWNILKPSRQAQGMLEFDHDLIRKAILQSVSFLFRQSTAYQLLGNSALQADPFMLCSLSFQAGRAEETFKYANNIADNALSLDKFQDALQASLLALAVSDPDIWTGVFDAQKRHLAVFIDDALALSEPCRRPFTSDTSRYQAVLKLLNQILEILTHIDGGSSELGKRCITEAEFISNKIKSLDDIMRIRSLHGRMLFERGDEASAIQKHIEAEELFARQASRPIDDARGQNLIRLATSLRAACNPAASREALKKAIKHRPSTVDKKAWAFLQKVIIHYGTSYFYEDFSKTRFYWEKAEQIDVRVSVKPRNTPKSVGLSFLTFLEGDTDLALELLQENLAVCEERNQYKQKVRILLCLSNCFMVKNDFYQAKAHLEEAEEIAIRYHIIRRLWRVQANCATLHEALGEHEKSMVYDRQCITALTDSFITNSNQQDVAPWMQRRTFLPFLNIYLRLKSTYDSSLEEIFGMLPDNVIKHLERSAASLECGQPLSGNLHLHAREIAGRKRFCLTE